MPEPVENTAHETEARANGWVPKEEFRGDESRWKSAEAFNETGKNIAAVSSERNKKLSADMDVLKQSMKEMRDGQFDLIREARKGEKAKYEQKLEKLKGEQEKAFDDGDKEKFQAVNAKIEKLEVPKEAPVKADVTTPDPEMVNFMAENTWYDKDLGLTAEADAIGQSLIRGGMQPGKEFLDKIAKKVKKLNPEKFETKQSPSPVEGGSSAGGGGGGKGKVYSDLPAEAKKACDRYVKDGLMKKEEYVKEYFTE
jgi:hypothetical protein